MTRGWWRENRLWLPVLPFALAALLLASSYNVKDFWYVGGLHDRIGSAEQGDFVSATDDYEDKRGATSRTFRVRLTGVEKTDVYPSEDEDEEPSPPPDGLDAVVAHLDWEAEPDQVLRFCVVSLVDDEGRRYDTDTPTTYGHCTPEDHPGPEYPFTEDDPRGVAPDGLERPPAWSTSPVFLVPEGRRITQVLVWWETPQYVALSVS